MFANRPSLKKYICIPQVKCAGRIVFTHLAGCFFAPGYKALGRACEHGVWGHSVFLNVSRLVSSAEAADKLDFFGEINFCW